MLIIANWKMKLNVAASQLLAQDLRSRLGTPPAGTEVVVCPSYLSLANVAAKLKGSAIKLGGQDCFWEAQGAYTGEIAPDDLCEHGCAYVILGHSERRLYLGETDEQIHRKLEAALRAKLTPVLCVGEDWQQRSAKQKDYVLIRQLQGALQGVSLGPTDRIVIAYEPVWAISTGGTGIEATPEEVQYAGDVIRHIVIDLFGASLWPNRIQAIYGGSVNTGNVGAFTSLPAMSGVLVGGASLKADEFVQVIQAATGSKA